METNNSFVFLFNEKTETLEDQLNSKKFQALNFMNKFFKNRIHVSSKDDDLLFDNNSFENENHRFKPLDYFGYMEKFLSFDLSNKIENEIKNEDLFSDKYILTGCLGLSSSIDLLFLCDIIPNDKKYKYFIIHFNDMDDMVNEKINEILFLKNKEFNLLMKTVAAFI